MEFNDAKAYADHIKTEHHEYGEEPDDQEIRHAALRKRYAEEIAVTGVDVVREFTPLKTAYMDAIAELVEEFYGTLSPEVREQFERRFHFTTIDNRWTNARISRSPDGRFYGVFVNSALITALHRLGKLELACLYPDQVESCSRFPDETVTREQIVEVYAEVYTFFSMYKIPLGPQVLLNEPINSIHLSRLKVQELLIMSHEVAHFLNGDLKPGNEDCELIAPFLNHSHQREHLADIVGFGLVLRLFAAARPVTREQRYLFLMCLIDLHKMQHLIQGIETEKYPHPLNRMAGIIEKFYGPATEEWVADALLNDRMANLSLVNFPEVVSDESIILEYIEEQLVAAFND